MCGCIRVRIWLRVAWWSNAGRECCGASCVFRVSHGSRRAKEAERGINQIVCKTQGSAGPRSGVVASFLGYGLRCFISAVTISYFFSNITFDSDSAHPCTSVSTVPRLTIARPKRRAESRSPSTTHVRSHMSDQHGTSSGSVAPSTPESGVTDAAAHSAFDPVCPP